MKSSHGHSCGDYRDMLIELAILFIPVDDGDDSNDDGHGNDE